MSRYPYQVGLISDTHGLMRPEALAALGACRLILHAGDVGDGEILSALGALAPVRAVRGNVDRGELSRLPLTEVIDLDGRLVYMLHNFDQLDLDPAASGFSAVVSGHSHLPSMTEQKGVLYVNPGSAGPRRFKLPASVGRLLVTAGGLQAELVDLGR